MELVIVNNYYRTKLVYLWSRVLNTPFWTIYNVLFVILYKELNASALQVTLLIALKPMAALFSPYWSALIYHRQNKIKNNLILANILKYAPFLLFPWMTNVWFFIAAFGLHMMFLRGAIPAWMETMRLNAEGKSRDRIFAIGAVIDYFGTAILPVAFGGLLDHYTFAWRWLFFGTAIIGLISTIFLFFLPLQSAAIKVPPISNLKNAIGKPWKESWNLVKRRPDFRRFQIGYMLGGTALMMIHASLPTFFVDVLQLSYMKIMIAMAFCKGMGFVISSPLWIRYFRKINIYRFAGIVTLLAALFPLILMTGGYHIAGLYTAYVIYGIMQAGSEISWNLSGPHFAKNEDSSVYSGTNVATVGIRGCLAPFLGSLLCTMTNSLTVMIVACILCLMAAQRMWSFGKKDDLIEPALNEPALNKPIAPATR